MKEGEREEIWECQSFESKMLPWLLQLWLHVRNEKIQRYTSGVIRAGAMYIAPLSLPHDRQVNVKWIMKLS